MKRKLVCFLLIIFVCLAAFFAVKRGEGIFASRNIDERRIIILDAGHGGLTNTTH